MSEVGKNTDRPSEQLPDEQAADVESYKTSRRDFLGEVGRKAAYIAPVLVTLSAAPAMATPHSESCKELTESCGEAADCCSGNCDTGQCIP